ncbi:unnamed protein product, partial [Didymodactylos carnosus]
RVATSLEEIVRQIFVEAFHLTSQNIDLNTPFGALGGTSLGAMKALTLIRQQLYEEMEIGLLFSNPSICQLAKVLEPLVEPDMFINNSNIREENEVEKCNGSKASLVIET